MKHGDDEEQGNGKERIEEQGNGKERIEERDRAVSELVVRIQEPDIYTPTLDLSENPGLQAQQELLRRAATKPGVRREIKTNAVSQLEQDRARDELSMMELRQAVQKYENEERKLLPWVLGFLAVVLAVGFVVLLGARK